MVTTIIAVSLALAVFAAMLAPGAARGCMGSRPRHAGRGRMRCYATRRRRADYHTGRARITSMSTV